MRGLRDGFADSDPVRGRFSVGWRKGGDGEEVGVEEDEEGEEVKGHIAIDRVGCSGCLRCTEGAKETKSKVESDGEGQGAIRDLDCSSSATINQQHSLSDSRSVR